MPKLFKKPNWTLPLLSLALVFCLEDEAMAQGENLARQLEALEEQNALLLQMLENQQTEIAALKSKIEEIANLSAHQSRDIEDLRDSSFDRIMPVSRPNLGSSIHISGAAGVAFYAGGANTLFPNEEFRVDEARLFVDAQIAKGVYLFSELELFTRESSNPDFQIGELYIEFEELLAVGDWKRALNLRVGRLDVPFGEEYQTRDVMDNPLISHSVADMWGIDEGIEAFGEMGRASYVLAVQNGSHDFLRDYTSDKSITARVGFDPGGRFHLSGSLMRTGSIDTGKEKLTELWFGNSLFRSIGSPATTRFDVDLAQLNTSFSWKDGYLGTAYGKAWYDDNDPAGDNSRDLNFWSMEVQQEVADALFVAARYSGMDVDGGYPVSGMADRGRFFFGPTLTEELRRLSLGVTYWPYPDMVLKLDYTWEEGKNVTGNKRRGTDQFSAEAGVRF